MAHYWVAAAAILFIIELFIGTVYLLVLSVACLGSAAVAWLWGTDAALLSTAVLSLVGCVWVWQHKQNQPNLPTEVDDLDMGQIVVLEKLLPSGDWQVHYRGTLWEARSAFSGCLKQGDTATIIGRDGNLLLIE